MLGRKGRGNALRRMGVALRLGTALALPMLLAAGASPARAAEKCVVPDMTWGISNVDKERTGQLLSEAGTQWVRMQLDWNWLDEDPSLLADYDRAVDVARRAGANVLLIASQSPSWASGSTKAEAPPQDPEDYAAWLGSLVEHFRGRVSAYEIWNEPDTVNFWPSGPDASEYVALLRAGHDAVKAHDPDAKVLFGGLTGNNRAYLEEAYAAEPQLGRYFDALGVHPYVVDAAPPEAVDVDDEGRVGRFSFTGYRELRKTMLEHGDRNPIWITEFGYSTTTESNWLGGVDEETQADYLTRSYRILESDPYVEVACWYNLRNNFWAPDADTWEDQLGLLHADFSPKPAFTAFAALGRHAAPSEEAVVPVARAAASDSLPRADGPSCGR